MKTDEQIDYLTERLCHVEERMIDPQDFGRMQGEVHALRRDLDKLVIAMAEQSKQLQAISDTLSEARGGWKLMLLVGGAGATLGAFSAKVLPGMWGGFIK